MTPTVPSEQYDPREFPPRAVTVDIVVFALRDGALEVLTVRRSPGAHPYPGLLALPGSFVRDDEDLGQAARRVLREKTGLELPTAGLEQFGAYGDPERDPRMRVISIGFMALVAEPDMPSGEDGESDPQWRWSTVDELLGSLRPPLAFDHERILRDADERLRVRIEETDAALDLLPEVFTLLQLRQAYEAIWRTEINPANFAKRIARVEGFIEPISSDPSGSSAIPDGVESASNIDAAISEQGMVAQFASPAPPSEKRRGRPPHRYRRGGVGRLHPPLRRPGTYFSRPPLRRT